MTTPNVQKTRHIIRDIREYMNLNMDHPDDEEFSDEDAWEHAMMECGQDGTGRCSLAGTEFCDWDCALNQG